MSQAEHRWTFLSNHAHVVLVLARDSEARVRDIAAAVGVTERAVQRILSELEEANVIERERVGRRNHYRLNIDQPLRHPLEANHTVGELIMTLLDPPSRKQANAS